MHYIRTTMACAAALLPLALIPAPVAADATVKLRCKFTGGEVRTYQTSGQLGIQLPKGVPQAGGKTDKTPNKPATFNVPVNGNQTVRVLKVEKNGDALLEISSDAQMAATLTGQPGGAGTVKSIQVTATPMGNVTALKGSGAGSTPDGFSGLNSIAGVGSIVVPMPDGAVRVGDTWTRKFALPDAAQAATVRCKFVSMGQVGRYKTAHISVTMSMPISSSVDVAAATKGKQTGKSRVSGSVTMHYEDDFALKEGVLVKSVGSGTSDISVGQPARRTGPSAAGAPPAPMHVTVKITVSSTLMR